MKGIVVLVVAVFMQTAAFANPNNIGDIPYNILGRTADGKEVKVSDFRGQVVVISFWATWCKYCMKELPVLSGIQNRSKPGRLQVIAVNYGEDKQLFRKIASALSDTRMVLTTDTFKGIGKKYGVDGIPHMVIVGNDGKVAAVHIGYSESELPDLVDEINIIASQPQTN